MLTKDQGIALLSFYFGADLCEVDWIPTAESARMGLVAWDVLPFAIVPYVTPEGRSALVTFLDDDVLAADIGLIEPCPTTIRSADLPEMRCAVRMFDDGVAARQNGDAAAYHRARRAEDERIWWAGPWLRGWVSLSAEVAA